MNDVVYRADLWGVEFDDYLEAVRLSALMRTAMHRLALECFRARRIDYRA